jgi:hypothetical protein
MAAEFWEIMAREDSPRGQWRGWHPNQRKFAKEHFGKFLEPARSTLAHMLTLPIDEKQKAMISEALILDRPLREHRTMNTQQVFDPEMLANGGSVH